jgi:hypothetical protein
MKQGREEPMESIIRIDARFSVSSIRMAALLIGRNLSSECVSCIGGVAKEKYTTPHDIALR